MVQPYKKYGTIFILSIYEQSSRYVIEPIKTDVCCPQDVHSEQYSVLTDWFKSEMRNVLEYKFKPQIFRLFFSLNILNKRPICV